MDPVRPDLMKLDFAALDTLCQLHACRSFTQVADRLGVNQSAVSYTIDRLRRAVGDPLFVKEAGRQVPTERCDALVEGALAILALWRETAAPVGFDPATATAGFTIACNYYERMLVIPAIARRLGQAAPGIALEIVNSSSDGHRRLLDQEADLLIGPFQRSESGFYAERLFDERYVCLMDPRNPAAVGEMTIERYLTLDHILITYGGNWKSRYIQELERTRRQLRVAMRVPSPAGVGQLVSGTNLVATIPERLAARIGQGQAVRPCPVPAPLQIAMVWTARSHAAPMHRWIRQAVTESVAGLI